MKRPGDWVREPSVTTDKVARPRHAIISEAVANLSKIDTTPENSEREFKKGDKVLVRTHYLSKAEKGFHAGFAPKWDGPVI